MSPSSHSLPPSLSLTCLVLFSLSLPIFSSSRSVLSWDIYSSPGPASLNRHTNPRLNIVWCSLHAFPSVSTPKTQRSAIHAHSALATALSASQCLLQDALKRMAVRRKCTHKPYDHCPRLFDTPFLESTERQRSL